MPVEFSDDVEDLSGLLHGIPKSAATIRSNHSGFVQSTVPVDLVGRNVEQRQLVATMDLVSSTGVGHVLLLGGDSGMGKTALAQWCLGYAATTRGDWIVQSASCEPFHAGMSFFPIQELLRRLSTGFASVRDLVAEGFGPQSSESDIAFKAFNEQIDPSDRRGYMMATFPNAIFAANRVAGRPALIFIDELERVDTASVDAIMVLASRLVDAPVLLLGCYRSDLVAGDRQHALNPLLEYCRRNTRSGQLMNIPPIPETSLQQLIDVCLGDPVEVSGRFLSRLYRETEGNPLFIREVVRGLRERAAASGQRDVLEASQRQVTWKLDADTEFLELPKSIEDAVSSRLTPLTDEQREIIGAASIIGRRFQYQTLLAVLEWTDDRVLEVIDDLVTIELLREVDGAVEEFEFTHGRLREVVVSQMTGLRRTRLHGKVADVIRAQQRIYVPEEWERILGFHLMNARRYEDAAPHLEEAGVNFLRAQSSAEAADYFRMCLDSLEKAVVPDEVKITHIGLLLGASLKLSGQLDAAQRVLGEVIISTAAPEATLWALDHLGDIHRMRDETEEAISLYERCQKEAEQAGDIELVAEVSADLAELHMREYERLAGIDAEKATTHFEIYKRYLESETNLIGEHSPKDARARSLRNRAKFERAAGKPEDAVELYEQSIHLDEGAPPSHQLRIPYAKALRLVGRPKDAMTQVELVLDWSRQIGAMRSEAIARQYRGLLLMEEGLDANISDRQALFEEARTELSLALKQHEEVNFKQGVRETATDLFELEVSWGETTSAIKYLAMAMDLGSHALKLSNRKLAEAVVEQLRSNGEQARANRLLERIGAIDLDGGGI